MTEYSPEADRNRHFDLITAMARERLVRSGTEPPLNEAERRQQQEGPCGYSRYECHINPPWQATTPKGE
jgi:hypothetical protein